MQYLRTALFIFPDRRPDPLLHALAAQIDDPNLAITVVRDEHSAVQLLHALAPTTVPDLLVLEVPRDPDVATARLERFRLLAPEIPIVAWLDAQDPELVLRLMEAGASDCLLQRTVSATTLADALGLAASRPALDRSVDRV
ncbi:MAG: hypothetical protein AAGF23_10525, partial [Acidobacteriota bacterium]